MDKKWSDLNTTSLLANISMFTIIYGVITNPIYVILAHKRISPQNKSIIEHGKTIKQNSGYGGFFRGCGIVSLGSLLHESVFMFCLEYHKENGYTKIYSPGVNDFASGIIAHSIVLPLENFISLIATKQMTAGLAHTNPYQNTIGTIITIYNQEKIRGFFKGAKLSAIYIPAHAAWWSLYGFNKSIVRQVSNNNIITNGVSAGLAGFALTFLLNPIDVLYTKIQSTNTKQQISTSIKNIYKESGIKGFYRGLLLNIVEKTFESAAYGITYDGIKDMSSS